jgi:hypothetical protein
MSVLSRNPPSLQCTGASPPKEGPGLKLRVPNEAYQVLASKPDRVKAVLQQHGEAVIRSRAAGHTVSFRVDVDPAGATTMTHVEESQARTETSARRRWSAQRRAAGCACGGTRARPAASR